MNHPTLSAVQVETSTKVTVSKPAAIAGCAVVICLWAAATIILKSNKE